MGLRVVVKRLAVPEVSRGGLFVLGREFPALGRVLRLGTGLRERSFMADLAIGDLVYFDRSKPELRGVPGEPEHFVLDFVDLYARIRG